SASRDPVIGGKQVLDDYVAAAGDIEGIAWPGSGAHLKSIRGDRHSNAGLVVEPRRYVRYRVRIDPENVVATVLADLHSGQLEEVVRDPIVRRRIAHDRAGSRSPNHRSRRLAETEARVERAEI